MNAARVSEFGQEGAAAFSRKKRGQFPEHAFGTRRAATGCCHSDKDPHALAAVDPHSTCAAAFTGIVFFAIPFAFSQTSPTRMAGLGPNSPSTGNGGPALQASLLISDFCRCRNCPAIWQCRILRKAWINVGHPAPEED